MKMDKKELAQGKGRLVEPADYEDDDGDDESSEPADEVSQEQYEYLSTAGQTAIYGDAKQFQQTVLNIAGASDPAMAAGQVVGRVLLQLVGKAEDESGADVDQDAIETAAQDLLELLYDDLIAAGVYEESDDENAFAEAAYHAAYGEYMQGRVATGKLSEEQLVAQSQDLQQMMAAGETE